MGWILNSLVDSIAEAVMDNENAQDLWKDLQERYGEADSVRLAHIRASIPACKQGTSPVTDYYNRLGVLWTEYLSFKSIPACECGDTPHTLSCVTYAAVKDSHEQDHTIDFIIGLNDTFEMAKNQLLLMDPAPNLKAAYKHALKLERQMGKQQTKEGAGVDSVALGAMNQNKGKESRGDYPRTPRQPSYPGLYPNQRSPSDNTGGNQQNLFCNYCKKNNHMIADCWKLKRKRGEPINSNFAAAATFGGSEEQGHDPPIQGQNQDNRPAPNSTTTLRLSSEDCSRLMLQSTVSLLFCSRPLVLYSIFIIIFCAIHGVQQPSHTPAQAHSVSRYINPMPNNAGPSFTEEDWFCKRS
ncbi:unnamed protein product [Linum trigynum]|uniref:Retrotransposon gag domain-containing protein n=1 Tax=Linum trigynum TaxID=586398 RepID=A0AAV2DVL8_9ROSI